MTLTDLPEPVLRVPARRPPDREALVADLRRRVDGEVRFDAGTRGAYSTDASNFRQVPIGVVVPRSVEAAVSAVAVCREHGAPVVSRGGGTSLAGQCTNEAVLIDWAKYCHRLVSVDRAARTCVVEPGIVLDVLNARLAEHGLRYGPEPATHPNCTIGGMIGNNSCGASAQRSGKVVDNLRRLEVLTYDGTRFWCGETSEEEYADIAGRGDRQATLYRQLRTLRERYGDEIRARYPDIPRRVSGYNLDSLLPEHGFDVAGLLVGSESTLVTVLQAELKLIPVLTARSVVLLGYDSVAAAGDAVPAVLLHEPIALEGLDHRLIRGEQLQQINPQALQELPEGKAYLLVQLGGDNQDEVDAAAQRMLQSMGKSGDDPDVAFVDDPRRERELWQVREAGLGATAHVPGHASTWPGWEDSAVAPDKVGPYLRDLEALYERYGFAGDTAPSLYGHFGQGCIHTRIPFELTDAGGQADYRRFLHDAARLLASYGGSLSGEHGDGQQRGELLPIMFGEEIVRAFGQLKAVFDPENKLNPGKVVAPYPLDSNLRLGRDWAPRTTEDLHFTYPHDGGTFTGAALRCVGVGKCRQQSHDGGSVMCPSYQVTLEEEHSTRGRARLLFEMLQGHPDSPVKDGWRSTRVRDALDLCLACKGCKSDCPVNVDMATYKAEFLAQHYHGRLRPRSHYALGWLPLLAAAVSATRLAGVVNALSSVRPLARVATRAAGLEPREVPLFAEETLQQWFARRPERPAGPRGRVLLWPDTFTNRFHPHVGQAAVEVMEAAGWTVTMPTEPLCCGLTWISTGQLDVAKAVLRRTVDHLADHVRAGGLVVGLEPSCTAVFRADAVELMGGDIDVERLRHQTVTLAELLHEHSDGWEPPDLHGVHAVAQVHCHQHAVMAWNTDQELLSRAGADASQLESGCCGLAGNFGFERGHLQVSRACAEQAMLPALRDADPATIVLADGFSCRTQIHELDSGGREGIHLAELLARALHGRAGRPVDLEPGDRPVAPPSSRLWASLAAAALLTVGAAGLAVGRRRPLRRRRGRTPKRSSPRY